MLDLKKLRYLDAIYKYGSFTQASKELFVSQPAISAAITSLEKQLGVELLIRNSKSVTFTPAGERFMIYTQHILQECEKAEQDMKYMCEELVKTATLNGKVGDEVDERFEELCAETGVRPRLTITATYFNATTKTVQLGDTITVKLTYETSLAGFGDFELPFEVSVSSSGLSRIYWK